MLKTHISVQALIKGQALLQKKITSHKRLELHCFGNLCESASLKPEILCLFSETINVHALEVAQRVRELLDQCERYDDFALSPTEIRVKQMEAFSLILSRETIKQTLPKYYKGLTLSSFCEKMKAGPFEIRFVTNSRAVFISGFFSDTLKPVFLETIRRAIQEDETISKDAKYCFKICLGSPRLVIIKNDELPQEKTKGYALGNAIISQWSSWIKSKSPTKC